MPKETKKETKIVIVGGGFGGIRCALDLAAKRLPKVKIILISDKPHFEYHAALYRVVTGRSPLEVCIPLREIFLHTTVELVLDTVVSIDAGRKEVRGSSGARWRPDILVLALGSETAYFGIPGLQKLSFGFKSITEALELKRHLHEVVDVCRRKRKDRRCDARIAVIGGGPSGVELAGELVVYMKRLSRFHGLDPRVIKLELIEAAGRLLPALPSSVSHLALERLQRLGVKVRLNQTVVREEVKRLFLKTRSMQTGTVIWTAGTKPNHLFASIKGLALDTRGRVIVDRWLQAKGHSGLYVLGDAAATQYTGMAQTALNDGSFTAESIAGKILGQTLQPYRPHRPMYAIPIGPGWAIAIIGSQKFSGVLGWGIRRLADLRFLFSILPWFKAWTAWRNGQTLCESCDICQPAKSR